MKNTRTFVQVSVLVTTLVVALLLLFGIRAVIASSAASAEFAPDFPAALSSATAWSSGWVTIPQGECPVFNHNLGGNPDDYAVELMFRDEPWALSIGIHRRNYGGLRSRSAAIRTMGGQTRSASGSGSRPPPRTTTVDGRTSSQTTRARSPTVWESQKRI
jgi:hypothetical protein